MIHPNQTTDDAGFISISVLIGINFGSFNGLMIVTRSMVMVITKNVMAILLRNAISPNVKAIVSKEAILPAKPIFVRKSGVTCMIP